VSIPGRDFGFMVRQKGMFSYTALTSDQVARLCDDFGIYLLSSGRLCVAWLNEANVVRVATAISKI
jgi:aromatic-amino-acid transaminase